MPTLVPVSFLGSVMRAIVAGLDAWSYRIAQSRAVRRRADAVARSAVVRRHAAR
ncbi:MAG: hypothetical protein KIS62_15920 [Ramlibacter sp.]|nr:hypothetical protein [Ramlibacter sp.]MBX3659699.1 hypothetical protein [Ramlibacter sp.]MCW5651236.1 hypothetical protein [Ramlibacter sp.]